MARAGWHPGRASGGGEEAALGICTPKYAVRLLCVYKQVPDPVWPRWLTGSPVRGKPASQAREARALPRLLELTVRQCQLTSVPQNLLCALRIPMTSVRAPSLCPQGDHAGTCAAHTLWPDVP